MNTCSSAFPQRGCRRRTDGQTDVEFEIINFKEVSASRVHPSLGVLTHTTALDQHWGGNQTLNEF